MSLNQILGTALTGLNASQAALRSISNNIANVNTPGYAREQVQLQALVAGGTGSGVGVSNVERITNRFLEAAAYAAHGDAGRASVQQAWLQRLVAEFGTPGADGGLAGRIDALLASAIELTGGAGDLAARRAFLDNVDAAVSEIQRLSTATSGQRAEAEHEISAGVDRINTLLKRIETQNAEIAAVGLSGGSTAALAGQRAQALDELGQLLAIDVRETSTGAVEVATRSGITLVDSRARRLSYVTPPATAGLAAYPPIEVLRVDPKGNGEPTGEVLSLANSGGRIGGFLDLRDRILPAVEAELAGLFASLATTLNAVHNEASAVPAPASLTGRSTGLTAADRGGFTGAAVFAVTDASGAVVARTRVDFSAMGPAATMGDVIAAINAGLGGAGTASLVDGQFRIAATAAGNGVVVAGDPSAPAVRAGQGFSAFFGLNDLVRANGLVASGLAASDPHGFATGETAAFRLYDASGRAIASATLSPVSGGSVGDMLAVLNGSAMGAHGAFSLTSAGAIVFTPNPGAAGARVALISDSTDRFGTGVSLGTLFQIPPAANATLTSASVRGDLTSDARRLAFGRFDTAAAAGQTALHATDGRGAERLAAALSGSVDLSGRVAEIVASVAADAALAADNYASAGARRDDAVQRLSDHSGVNLDEELAQMIVFQNSYSAAARVISAAAEMYDILLTLGD